METDWKVIGTGLTTITLPEIPNGMVLRMKNNTLYDTPVFKGNKFIFYIKPGQTLTFH